jgi:hypothetical protein
MNHVPLAPFSNYIAPFWFVGKVIGDIPNENWNNINASIPDYNANKEQYDDRLFLKQQPRRFYGTLRQGVYFNRCVLEGREVGSPPWREEDWALQIEITECDVKHRPWEGTEITVEMAETTPTSTTYYNYTLELNSSNFAITPALTDNYPPLGFYRTGYNTGSKTFYSITGILGTDIARGTTAKPYKKTTINKIVSITPSSAYEPPTPA